MEHKIHASAYSKPEWTSTEAKTSYKKESTRTGILRPDKRRVQPLPKVPEHDPAVHTCGSNTHTIAYDTENTSRPCAREVREGSTIKPIPNLSSDLRARS